MGEGILYEPGIAEWATLLAHTRASLGSRTKIPDLRRDVFRAARAWTNSFDERFGMSAGHAQRGSINGDSGNELPGGEQDSAEGGGDEELPLIMTGHQPIFCHAGIFEKYRAIAGYLAAHPARAVNVIIDTDESEGGRVIYPERADGVLRLRFARVAGGGDLFLADRLTSREEIHTLSSLIRQSWDAAQPEGEREVLHRVLDFLEQHAGDSLMEVTTAVRRIFGRISAIQELPLSELLKITAVQEFVAELFRDHQRFHEVYNAVLVVHRQKRGIRNLANPFPTLRATGTRHEMPFWILRRANLGREECWVEDVGTRVRLFAREELLGECERGELAAFFQRPQGPKIVPRGGAITFLLRLLASDLFVHGVGGRKYDTFTDEFIRSYVGAEPPPFVTISATRYLFPSLAERFRQENARAHVERKLQFRPEPRFGTGLFLPHEEQELVALRGTRETLIPTLKSLKKARAPRRALTQRFKELDRAFKEIVTRALLRETQVRPTLLQAEEAVVCCREFPFFMIRKGGYDG